MCNDTLYCNCYCLLKIHAILFLALRLIYVLSLKVNVWLFRRLQMNIKNKVQILYRRFSLAKQLHSTCICSLQGRVMYPPKTIKAQEWLFLICLSPQQFVAVILLYLAGFHLSVNTFGNQNCLFLFMKLCLMFIFDYEYVNLIFLLLNSSSSCTFFKKYS